MKFLYIVFIALLSQFKSLGGEELNRLLDYQINHSVSPYSAILDVRSFELAYDVSNNPIIEDRGIRNFTILFYFTIEVNRFNPSKNTSIQILKESNYKNKFNDAVFDLRIDGKDYKAFGKSTNPNAIHWNDLSPKIYEVKSRGDWQSGMKSTYFKWKGHSFMVYDDFEIQNDMTIKLIDESHRTQGESYFSFVTEDHRVFTAVGQSIWGPGFYFFAE